MLTLTALLLVGLVIALLVRFGGPAFSENSARQRISGGSSTTAPAIGGLGVTAHTFYRTKDGLADYKFSFEKQSDGNYRAYIADMPAYSTRNTSLAMTHRLTDAGRYYICWAGALPTVTAVQQVAALWSDLTQEYIKTGRTIDAQMARLSR